MLLLDSVVPEEWYSVKQVSGILGRGVDAVRDWIYDGHLQGFIKPGTSSKGAEFTEECACKDARSSGS